MLENAKSFVHVEGPPHNIFMRVGTATTSISSIEKCCEIVPPGGTLAYYTFNCHTFSKECIVDKGMTLNVNFAGIDNL